MCKKSSCDMCVLLLLTKLELKSRYSSMALVAVPKDKDDTVLTSWQILVLMIDCSIFQFRDMRDYFTLCYSVGGLIQFVFRSSSYSTLANW